MCNCTKTNTTSNKNNQGSYIVPLNPYTPKKSKNSIKPKFGYGVQNK